MAMSETERKIRLVLRLVELDTLRAQWERAVDADEDEQLEIGAYALRIVDAAETIAGVLADFNDDERTAIAELIAWHERRDSDRSVQ
jgi:hypothetical protein